MANLLRARSQSPGDSIFAGLTPSVSGVYLPRAKAPAAAASAPVSTTAAVAQAAPSVARIAPGTGGPGGAKFGMGGGGGNRYDHTQLGAGLWSVGIDINAPDAKAQVQRWFDSQPANVRAEVQRGMGPQPGRGSMDPLVYAADWRQRDVARKIKIDNSFMSSTLGQIVSLGLQVGAALIPGGGPALSAAVGATIGGATGGIKGAVMGGVSGYGVGTATQFVAGGGLSRTASSILGKTAAAPTQAAANAVGFTPAQQGGNVLTRTASAVGGAVKGAVSNAGATLNTAATAINAGIGLRDILAGGAGAATVALAANAMSTPSLNTTTPATPPAQKTEYELQVEKERKRRVATKTDLTWSNALTAPAGVRRPSLLGGSSVLGVA